MQSLNRIQSYIHKQQKMVKSGKGKKILASLQPDSAEEEISSESVELSVQCSIWFDLIVFTVRFRHTGTLFREETTPSLFV